MDARAENAITLAGKETAGPGMNGKRTIDFVIPAYNEADNIDAMVARIVKAFEAIGVTSFKILFVENGSSDNSAALLAAHAAKDPRVVGISLSRNFGPQGAIHAGLSHSDADYVCVLDGDQQDPPEDAANMFKLMQEEGADVVYAVRRKREEKALRKAGFKTFYRVWRLFSYVEVPLDAGEFAVMRRSVVDAILSSPEIHRFNRGLRSWVGFRQIPYQHDRPNRVAGEQKFNIVKDTVLGLQAVLSFSLLPIRLILVFGFMLAGVSFAILAVNALAILLNAFGHSGLFNLLPRGIITLNLIQLLFQGVMFIAVGVIGEYVGRIYEQAKARPTFITKKIIGSLDA
ncbi:MAG: glycosyltransferase family 2 protein [Hyphomicrobiaceae bacterium]|nr:glycosyltransferase family 2 protein [Hyphomicrobiaceae bacterium]